MKVCMLRCGGTNKIGVNKIATRVQFFFFFFDVILLLFYFSALDFSNNH